METSGHQEYHKTLCTGEEIKIQNFSKNPKKDRGRL